MAGGTLGRNLHLCFTKFKRPLDPQPSSLPLNNFNSLYDFHFDSAPSNSPPPHHRFSSSSSTSSSSSSEPDFATVFASQRFFFSSPGRSNSIIESADSSDSPVSQNCGPPPLSHTDTIKHHSLQPWDSPTVKDSVAVQTYSPDPYLDFRQSMQEMVEARGYLDVKANWDYLHELLLCYLALNPKSTHKFIVRAFADLLVSLLASSQPSQPQPTAVGE